MSKLIQLSDVPTATAEEIRRAEKEQNAKRILTALIELLKIQPEEDLNALSELLLYGNNTEQLETDILSLYETALHTTPKIHMI